MPASFYVMPNTELLVTAHVFIEKYVFVTHKGLYLCHKLSVGFRRYQKLGHVDSRHPIFSVPRTSAIWMRTSPPADSQKRERNYIILVVSTLRTVVPDSDLCIRVNVFSYHCIFVSDLLKNFGNKLRMRSLWGSHCTPTCVKTMRCSMRICFHSHKAWLLIAQSIIVLRLRSS